MTERLEKTPGESPTADFSPTKFFEDVYNKGLVTAIEERPREAAVSAVAAVAAGAAAIGLSKGRVLSGLFGASGEQAGQALHPVADALMRLGIPVSAESRAAAANPQILRLPAWERLTGIEAASGKHGAAALESATNTVRSPIPVLTSNHAAFRERFEDNLLNGSAPYRAEARTVIANILGTPIDGATMRAHQRLMLKGIEPVEMRAVQVYDRAKVASDLRFD